MYPCLLDEDGLYWFTTIEDWQKVFEYVDDALECLDKYSVLKYMKARRDCEDFAILHKGLVSAFFGLNAYALAIGTTPMGQHAFTMMKTGGGFRLWEPQVKASEQKPFKINDEHGYVPQYILL